MTFFCPAREGSHKLFGMDEMTPSRSNKRSELSAPTASVFEHFGLAGVVGAVTGAVPVGKAVGGTPTGNRVGAAPTGNLVGATTGAELGGETGAETGFLFLLRPRPRVLAAPTEAMIKGKNFMFLI